MATATNTAAASTSDQAALESLIAELGNASAAGSGTAYGGATSATGSGTALNPNYSYSPTVLGNLPPALLADPATMASAWGIPTTSNGVNDLSILTGFSGQGPINVNDQNIIDRGVSMFDLYGKLQAIANGKKETLTKAEINAATALGGPIARAAQLLGESSKVIPGKPGKKGQQGVTLEPSSIGGGGISMGEVAIPTPDVGGTSPTPATVVVPSVKSKAVQQALGAASKELEQRVKSTLGIDLSTYYKNGKPDPSVKITAADAGILQNAGYAVTSNSTVEQALEAVSQPANKGGPQQSQSQTVNELLTNLTSGKMTSAEITNLQNALYTGGMYDPSYYDGGKVISKGNLDTGTVTALRTAISLTGELQAQGKQVTLQDVLQDPHGPDKSVFGSVTSTPSVAQATAPQLQGTLESAMETYLGRLPTQQELSGFTSYMDSLQQQGSKALALSGGTDSGFVDYQTGIPLIPQVPTPAAAAESYVQNTQGPSYQAHNIANSMGLLLQLIDRQNVSAYTTPGAKPDTLS